MQRKKYFSFTAAQLGIILICVCQTDNIKYRIPIPVSSHQKNYASMTYADMTEQQTDPWYDVAVGSTDLIELSIMTVNCFVNKTPAWLSNAHNHCLTQQPTSHITWLQTSIPFLLGNICAPHNPIIIIHF